MSRISSEKDIGFIPRPVLFEFYYKTWQHFGEKPAKIITITLQNSANNI